VSSSTAENPTYTFNDVGIFPITLIATSEFGCSDTATSQVITNSNIEFPTAFTPNPNGASGGKYDANSLDNDVFFPYLKGAKEYHLEIFNRWGELVFESNDYSYGWDGYYKGKICQSDVYVWKLNMTFKNGKSKLMTGDVTLLR
jgi:gliding motility-associated-like protein